MSGAWLLLPILLPLLAGVGAMGIRPLRARQIYVAAVLAAEIALTAVLSWSGAAPFTLLRIAPGVEIVLWADRLGRFFALLVSAVWLAAAVFAFEYMNHEEHRERFFGFYLMTLGVMTGICFSANLVTLYLFYELMTLLSLPLVIHTGTRAAYDAGLKYMGFSVLGAGMALMGLFILSGYCSTGLFAAGGVLDAAKAAGHEGTLLWVFFLMVVGFGCKAGMFPLHAWLPTAHPVAPAPASAVLSGLITKMGILAIIRVTYYLFGADFLRGSWAQQAAMSLALVTIFMGSMLALREDTLKKRLAYSSVSQVSYVIFGLMTMSRLGFAGALLQIVFHAIAKNCLFLSAGSIIYKTHNTQVSQLVGVGSQCPLTMWCFTFASLSLIGIPPTGGFVSKWFLAQGSLDAGLGALAYVGIGVLMLSALLTAGYLLPVTLSAFFPGNDWESKPQARTAGDWRMALPLAALAAGVVVLGMFPGLLEPLLGGLILDVFPVPG